MENAENKNDLMQEKLMKFSEKLKSIQIYIEIPLILVAIGGILFLKNINLDTGIMMLMISLLGLGTFYFILGFNNHKTENYIDIFFQKIYYWSLSISVIAIVFALLHWPDSKIMQTIGLIGVSTSLFYYIYAKIKNKIEEKLFYEYLIRLVLAILIIVYLLFLS